MVELVCRLVCLSVVCLYSTDVPSVAFISIPGGRSLRPVKKWGCFVKVVDQNSPHFSLFLF